MWKIEKMIITNNLIFNDNTVNIFTDASIKKFGEETVGCAGAYIVTGLDPNFGRQVKHIIRNSTNNNSEITAIWIGVNEAIKLRQAGFKGNINLFSDSKICIFGLREWIFKWVRKSPGDQLIGSQGDPVLNQDVILQIVYTIMENNLNINLFHQNGHVLYNLPHHIEKAKKTFIQSNFPGLIDDVEDQLIYNISVANDIVDTFTRDELEVFYPANSLYGAEKLVEVFYDPETKKDILRKYNKLVGTININL